MVAAKCGVPLPKREFISPEEAEEAGLRRQLLDLHEAATSYFEEKLKSPEGALAREYLAGRGVTAEAIKKFRIGYAPESFNALRERLSGWRTRRRCGSSGLFSAKEQEDGTLGRLYERFRQADDVSDLQRERAGDRVYGAGAGRRAREGGLGQVHQLAGDAALFEGAGAVQPGQGQGGRCGTLEFALLVEGQMDCISVFMRGIQNVIATSGTAFTEHAGGAAAAAYEERGGELRSGYGGGEGGGEVDGAADGRGFTIKVVTLEGGLDPDRYMRERGVEAYMAAIRGARRQSDYLIERARQSFRGRAAEAKVKAMNFLLPHIRRMPEKLAAGPVRA